jgi:alanine racemase
MNSSGYRPTWAEIDLDALAHNFGEVRRRIAPGVLIMGVVKANAYGHGAPECSRRLATEGVDWFGVASPEEGIELRRVGITQPILSFGGAWDGQWDLCLHERITPVVYRLDVAEAFDRAARDAKTTADVHVKIDTGMGRLGVRFDEAAEFAERMLELKNVRVDGLMTHFASADEPAKDCFTEEQTVHFKQATQAFRGKGHDPRFEHTANGAATFGHPSTHGNMVRPGGVLYGLWRDVLPPLEDLPRFRPVMSLRSRIALLKTVHRGETLGYGCSYEATREMLVATLPLGYADGYGRAHSNRGRALVRGTFATVVGRISMDWTLLDVTDVPGVETGDTVTLLGTDSELEIPAEDLAKTADTISYEVTCAISSRVPRRYSDEVD